MMEQTRISTALKGVRGRAPGGPGRTGAAAGPLLATDRRAARIQELDINPLLASPEALIALDARVVLHPSEVSDHDLPRLPIRPYPMRYQGSFTAKSGEVLTIRPIRPEDEPAMVKFHETLSERTVYFRYLQMIHLTQRTAHERLTRMCFIDYDREMALVAVHDGEVVAVTRMHKMHSSNAAEFAIVVSDAWHGKGLGLELLRRLLDVARQEGVGRIVADIHAENSVMQKMCQRLGFRMMREAGDPTMHAELDL